MPPAEDLGCEMGASPPFCNRSEAHRPFRRRAQRGGAARPAPFSLIELLIECLDQMGSRRRASEKRLVVLGGRRALRRVGEVWLVGAGPGDPELLTVKALNLLKRAEVVVHDGLVSKEILDLAPVAARRISVAKRKSRHSYAQDEINR